jgi:GNAT superfamily N-acetyltransferase
MRMTFRPGKAADLPAMERLTSVQTDRPPFQGELDRDRPPSSLWLVVTAETGELMGFAYAAPDGGEESDLLEVSVHMDGPFQKHLIGTMLYAQVEAWARVRRAIGIKGQVAAGDADGFAWAAGVGFQPAPPDGTSAGLVWVQKAL